MWYKMLFHRSFKLMWYKMLFHRSFKLMWYKMLFHRSFKLMPYIRCYSIGPLSWCSIRCYFIGPLSWCNIRCYFIGHLKLSSLFAAWFFWIFIINHILYESICHTSHSWSPFLPLTCLYKDNEHLWVHVSLSRVFSRMYVCMYEIVQTDKLSLYCEYL